MRHISQNILDNDINLTELFIVSFHDVLGRIFEATVKMVSAS